MQLMRTLKIGNKLNPDRYFKMAGSWVRISKAKYRELTTNAHLSCFESTRVNDNFYRHTLIATPAPMFATLAAPVP